MSTLRMTFVHVAEQVHFEPVTAQLAGLVKSMSWWPWQILTDYSTTRDAFEVRLREHEPLAVVFRVTKQTREIVEYLARVVAEQPEQVPIFFFGPLCQSHPEEAVGLAPRSIVLTGEPEVGMRNVLSVWPDNPLPSEPPAGVWYCWDGQLLRGEAGEPVDLDQAPKPDLNVFGGDRVFRRGIGASMFGETKVLPLVCGRGSPSGGSPNQGLSIFGYDTPENARMLDVDAVAFRLRILGPRVKHYEIWDREFGYDAAFGERLLDILYRKHKKKTWSLRVLAETFDPAVLGWTTPRFCRRVITELDAATTDHHRMVPGSQDPEKVAVVCDAARASGYLPALLVSVGLPFETADDIDRKIAFIREVGAARVRFVPFEARYGYPVWDVCEEAGMFNGRGETWNREVYHPLNQPSIDIEDWHRAWQRCLDLQAELQLTHPSEFEPRAREETT